MAENLILNPSTQGTADGKLPINKGKVAALVLATAVIITGSYLVARADYLVFHSFADTVTVLISAGVFVIVWNGRRTLDNHFYIFVGIAFLFFAFFDFIHMLGNKGMGVFPQYGNLGPTLYIASRYVISISLLISPLFIKRKFNTAIVFSIYTVVSVFILLSIFYWKNFPVTFIEGQGLTRFKIISDYIICVILLGAIGALLANRKALDRLVVRNLIISLVLSILTGLAFTLYTDPFGVTNMVGHFLQIGSSFFVYRAFVDTALTKPQDILFRSLKLSQEKAIELNKELVKANSNLTLDIAERKKAEEALRNSEKRFRDLFSSMTEGVAEHEIIRDGSGKAIDYKLTNINPAFESITGLSQATAAGAKASELYGINEPPFLDIYSRVTETGQPETFTTYFQPMEKHFNISVFSPGSGKFVTVFSDITERKRTEEEVRRHEAEITTLFENIPAGLVLFDGARPYKVLVHNKYYQELFAEPFYSQGMAGLNIFEYAPEVDASGVAAVFDEVVKTKQGKSLLDFPYKANSQKETWFNWYIAPIMINDKVVALVSMSLDVTERHMAAQALKESEERFRAIAETSPVHIAASRVSDGTIVFINSAYAETFGHTPEELIGTKGVDVYFDPTDREIILKLMAEQGFINEHEVRFKRRDGTPFWVSTSARIVSYSGEKVILAASIDITKRKTAEEALQTALNRFYSVLAAMPLGILLITSEGITEFTNQAFCDIFNVKQSPEALRNLTGGEIIGIIKNSYLKPEEAVTRINEIVAEMKTVKDEEVQMGDGRTLLRDFIRVDLGQKNHGRLWIHRDISERKKTEQLKDEFIGLVSHELKTPLTVIIGALSVAKNPKISETDAHQLMGDALESAKGLADIIENLIELSRYQSNRLAVKTEPTDITKITRETVSKLQSQSDIHSLTIDFPPDIPMVMSDRVRLERILKNLIENAIKYSPKGGEVRIAARVEADQIILSVSDHGIGISESDQRKLFNSFERLQASETYSIPGVGLGLRVCRILVEAHQGRIWLDSELGKGTTFFFSLPIAKNGDSTGKSLPDSASN